MKHIDILVIILACMIWVGFIFKQKPQPKKVFDYRIELNRDYTITILTRHNDTVTVNSPEEITEFIIKQNT